MTTTTFQIYKETALPGTLQPSSIYFIAPPGSTDYVEIYVTNSNGTVARRVIDANDVQLMINSTLAGANELTIVNDIAARDALLPLTVVKSVYVVDATGDSTVASGGATYLYNVGTSTWIKVSEAESMDVVFNWTSIVGRPTSSAAAIDAAVAASHTHANMNQLNKVGEDSGGNLTYGGSLPHAGWDSVNW